MTTTDTDKFVTMTVGGVFGSGFELPKFSFASRAFEKAREMGYDPVDCFYEPEDDHYIVVIKDGA